MVCSKTRLALPIHQLPEPLGLEPSKSFCVESLDFLEVHGWAAMVRSYAAAQRFLGRWMGSESMIQVAFTTILRHFVETGRAPHYSELAGILGVDLDEARDLQRAAAAAAPAETCWLAHDTDHVESWAPFSNVPTHFLISVEGVQKWYGQ